MLDSKGIEESLKRLGFVQHIDHERINGFRRSDIEHSLYVKTPSGNTKSNAVIKQPLVLHSEYESKKEEIEKAISGIHVNWDEYFHNSNLKGFLKRKNKGQKEIHFGLAADIEDEKVLRNLVAWLSGKQVQVKTCFSESEDIENAEAELNSVSETVKEALVQARRGQGKYREQLVSYWGECAVSNVSMLNFLKVSHIKPWRDSSNSERLDLYNGLLLNPVLDLAFDQGFISFSDKGELLMSDEIKEIADTLSISSDMKLKKVDSRHCKYFDWHRQNIFKGTTEA